MLDTVKYRRPHGTEWEELELEQAMDMIADRLLETPGSGPGRTTTRRTGGRGAPWGSPASAATLDNEENWLAPPAILR
jgi:formate dehydrogenase major subunit